MYGVDPECAVETLRKMYDAGSLSPLSFSTDVLVFVTEENCDYVLGGLPNEVKHVLGDWLIQLAARDQVHSIGGGRTPSVQQIRLAKEWWAHSPLSGRVG